MHLKVSSITLVGFNNLDEELDMNDTELNESKTNEINHNNVHVIYIDENNNKDDSGIKEEKEEENSNNQNEILSESDFYPRITSYNRRPSGWFKESTRNFFSSASSIISRPIKEDDIQSTTTNKTFNTRRKSIQPQAAFFQTEEASKAIKFSVDVDHDKHKKPNRQSHYSNNHSILKTNNVEFEQSNGNGNLSRDESNKDEFIGDSVSVQSVSTVGSSEENRGLLNFTKIVAVAYGLLMSIIGCATCIAIAISKKSDESLPIFRDVILKLNSFIFTINLTSFFLLKCFFLFLYLSSISWIIFCFIDIYRYKNLEKKKQNKNDSNNDILSKKLDDNEENYKEESKSMQGYYYDYKYGAGGLYLRVGVGGNK